MLIVTAEPHRGAAPGGIVTPSEQAYKARQDEKVESEKRRGVKGHGKRREDKYRASRRREEPPESVVHFITPKDETVAAALQSNKDKLMKFVLLSFLNSDLSKDQTQPDFK